MHCLRYRAYALGAAVIGAALIAGCGGSGAKSVNDGGKLSPGVPIAATQTQLLNYQVSVKHPVYWLGPFRGYKYELTETAKFDTYIRYLPLVVPIGTRQAKYTTIGTYPELNAYKVLAKDATQKGWRSRLISYKGIAVWNTQRATSVYLAYPKLSYLIEVFDPSAANALKVALSGEMEPVRASEVVRVLSVTKSTN